MTKAKTKDNEHGPSSPSSTRDKGGHPGGPRQVLTKDRVIEALRLSGGIRLHAAHKLGVNRRSLSRFLEKHPDVREVCDEVEEEIGDVAEAGLFKMIQAGEFQAIKFFAETKMKQRGYTRQLNVAGKDGGPIEHKVADDAERFTSAIIGLAARAGEKQGA